MQFYSFVLIIMSLFCLAACGGKSPEPASSGSQIGIKDPKDEKLFEAITAYVAASNAPPNSTYDYVRVDLNGDGRREGIVLFKLPHTYWCGWDGCGMTIFQASNNGFALQSTINNVRGPIYVRRTGHQGWRDIIIRVSGTTMPDRNIVMAYKNGRYPQSPLLGPTMHQPLSSMNLEKYF